MLRVYWEIEPEAREKKIHQPRENLLEDRPIVVPCAKKAEIRKMIKSYKSEGKHHKIVSRHDNEHFFGCANWENYFFEASSMDGTKIVVLKAWSIRSKKELWTVLNP